MGAACFMWVLVVGCLGGVGGGVVFGPPLWLRAGVRDSVGQCLERRFPMFAPGPILCNSGRVFLFSATLCDFS